MCGTVSSMPAFAHNQGNPWTSLRGTIALNIPSKKDLENLVNLHGTCTLFYMGAARLKVGLPFVKKDGRDYAESMMVWCKANLLSVEVRETKYIYHFRAEVPSKAPVSNNVQLVDIGLSTIASSEHVCLVYAELIT